MATKGSIDIMESRLTKFIATVFYIAAFYHLVVGALVHLGFMRQPIIELIVSPAWIYHAVAIIFYLLIAIAFTKRLKKK